MAGGKAPPAGGAPSSSSGSGGGSGNPPPSSGGSSKSLHSFPVLSVAEDAEKEEADEEVHRDEECSIKVGAGWE